MSFNSGKFACNFFSPRKATIFNQMFMVIFFLIPIVFIGNYLYFYSTLFFLVWWSGGIAWRDGSGFCTLFSTVCYTHSLLVLSPLSVFLSIHPNPASPTRPSFSPISSKKACNYSSRFLSFLDPVVSFSDLIIVIYMAVGSRHWKFLVLPLWVLHSLL